MEKLVYRSGKAWKLREFFSPALWPPWFVVYNVDDDDDGDARS